MELSTQNRRVLLDVARQTIRQTLGRSSPAVQIPEDAALQQPAGCFVTLHAIGSHRLRGCVGRLDTTEPLVKVVRQSAINVLDDPRFANFPVCLHELHELELEITVIYPLRAAGHVMDFDLLEEGIYLTVQGRSGCFLPQVARETGWTREQLLSRLCSEKLGVSSEAWKSSNVKLMKFSTLMIGPEPFDA